MENRVRGVRKNMSFKSKNSKNEGGKPETRPKSKGPCARLGNF